MMSRLGFLNKNRKVEVFYDTWLDKDFRTYSEVLWEKISPKQLQKVGNRTPSGNFDEWQALESPCIHSDTTWVFADKKQVVV